MVLPHLRQHLQQLKTFLQALLPCSQRRRPSSPHLLDRIHRPLRHRLGPFDSSIREEIFRYREAELVSEINVDVPHI